LFSTLSFQMLQQLSLQITAVICRKSRRVYAINCDRPNCSKYFNNNKFMRPYVHRVHLKDIQKRGHLICLRMISSPTCFSLSASFELQPHCHVCHSPTQRKSNRIANLATFIPFNYNILPSLDSEKKSVAFCALPFVFAFH